MMAIESNVAFLVENHCEFGSVLKGLSTIKLVINNVSVITGAAGKKEKVHASFFLGEKGRRE